MDPLFIYAGLKEAKASESLQKSLLEEFYFPKGEEFKINGNTTMYRHNMWTTLIGDLHKQNLLEGYVLWLFLLFPLWLARDSCPQRGMLFFVIVIQL